MNNHSISLRALAIAVVTLLFVSCDNPAVEVTSSVDMTIHLSTIMSGFVPFKSSNLDMYSSSDGDAKVRVTCLCYDKNKMLQQKEEFLVNDFEQVAQVSMNVADDGSTLVVLASCILGDLKSPDYEAYEIKGTSSLSTLTVNQLFDNSFYSSWSVLGYYVQELNPSEETLTIYLNPATAMVYLNWSDIHAHDNDWGIDNYYIIYHNNDVISFSSWGISPSTTLSTTDNNGQSLEPSDYPDTYGIYMMINLFPGTFKIFGRTFIGNTSNDYGSQQFTVEAGRQYVMRFDCQACTLKAYEGVFGS